MMLRANFLGIAAASALIAVLLAGPAPSGNTPETPPAATGIIYIVFAIDTEPLRIPPWERHPVLDFADFDSSGSVAAVMKKSWRESYRDSFGGLPRFTWFVLSHEVLFHARGGNGAMVYDTLLKFADAIADYGDEIGWHYHHADWTDLDHDGKKAWNQLTTFGGAIQTDGSGVRIAERSLNTLLAERHFFPTAFRAGWTWEDNGLSAWLEKIIPFDFSAYPPNIGNRSMHEPLRNVYDWSQAPTSYTGYHPSRSDYQKPGRMHRLIFRTVSPNTEREWGRLFVAAAAGEDQVFCFTAHSYDRLRTDIDAFLGRLLHAADSLGIPTRFATASRAAAAVAGTPDSPSPRLSIHLTDTGVVIRTDGQIFQPIPYCIAIDSAGSTGRLIPVADDSMLWRISNIPAGCREIVCAVSNVAGHSAVAAVTIK